MEEELIWMRREGARIKEEQHKRVQPKDLDCENCLGSDLNGVYETEHKPKGM